MEESVKGQRSESERKQDEGFSHWWKNWEDTGLQVALLCMWKRSKKELYKVHKM